MTQLLNNVWQENSNDYIIKINDWEFESSLRRQDKISSTNGSTLAKKIVCFPFNGMKVVRGILYSLFFGKILLTVWFHTQWLAAHRSKNDKKLLHFKTNDFSTGSVTSLNFWQPLSDAKLSAIHFQMIVSGKLDHIFFPNFAMWCLFMLCGFPLCRHPLLSRRNRINYLGNKKGNDFFICRKFNAKPVE